MMLAFPPVPVCAELFAWTNASGGSYALAANWTGFSCLCSGIPAFADAISFGQDYANYTVVMTDNRSVQTAHLIAPHAQTVTWSLGGFVFEALNQGHDSLGVASDNVLRIGPGIFQTQSANIGGTVDILAQSSLLVANSTIIGGIPLSVFAGDADVIVRSSALLSSRTIVIGTGVTGQGGRGTLVVENGGEARAYSSVEVGLDSLRIGLVDLKGGLIKVTTGGVNVKALGKVGGVGFINVHTALSNRRGGVIAPGPLAVVSPLATGSLSVTGIGANFNQSAESGYSAGSLEIEIKNSHEYDTLAVEGTATLGGTLKVIKESEFSPNAGDWFRIMTVGARSETFDDTVFESLGACKTFRVVYSCGGYVELVVTTTLDGDANLDGYVDDADIALIAANASAQGCRLTGDVNYDGWVDDADMTIAILNAGAHCP